MSAYFPNRLRAPEMYYTICYKLERGQIKEARVIQDTKRQFQFDPRWELELEDGAPVFDTYEEADRWLHQNVHPIYHP